MSAVDVFSAAVVALGWCLVHFLWQALAIGGAYAIARWLLPRGNPRYLAAMLALLALAACPIATGVHEWRAFAQPADGAGMFTAAPAAVGAPAAGARIATAPAWSAWLQSGLPWLVLAWAGGVGVLGARVFRQWRGLRAVLREAEALPAWQARARQLADRFGFGRAVPVLASLKVATPTLIGWLRPAVVLPVAVLARMPAEQIELVLAHELAHLKRLDHLANLFQLVLETALFYHPVVHWISRDARRERELCCDVLALRVTDGQRRDFVAALANLAEFRTAHAGLVLAASGGVLAERAWFIARGAPARPERRSRGHLAIVVAAAVLLGAGWTWWQDAAWQARAAAIVAEQRPLLVPQLGPARLSALEFPPVLSARAYPGVAAVPPALVEAAVGTSAPAAPIRIAPIGKPTWQLGTAPARLQPVAGPDRIAPAPIAAAAPRDVGAPPRVLRTSPPVYPAAAMLAGIQGQVVVTFALDAAGVPHDLEVAGSDSDLLDAAALRALSKWRFAPPTAPGQRFRQAFDFRFGAADAADAGTERQCTVSTGTHICRRLPDAATGLRVLQPAQ